MKKQVTLGMVGLTNLSATTVWWQLSNYTTACWDTDWKHSVSPIMVLQAIHCVLSCPYLIPMSSTVLAEFVWRLHGQVRGECLHQQKLRSQSVNRYQSVGYTAVTNQNPFEHRERIFFFFLISCSFLMKDGIIC